MIQMTIVKATFTTSASGAKASVRYIAHRPDQEGEKSTRDLWTAEGKVSRDEAYQLIEQAGSNTYFYRFAMSPDPAREDTKRDLRLRSATADMMQSLDDRFGMPITWIAATHENHSPHRHVHIIAIIPKRLDRNDLTLLRETATDICKQQRLARDKQLQTHQKDISRERDHF